MGFIRWDMNPLPTQHQICRPPTERRGVTEKKRTTAASSRRGASILVRDDVDISDQQMPCCRVGFWGFCTKAGAEVFCGQSSFSIACTLMDPLQIAAAAGEENFLFYMLGRRMEMLCNHSLDCSQGPFQPRNLSRKAGGGEGAKDRKLLAEPVRAESKEP